MLLRSTIGVFALIAAGCGARPIAAPASPAAASPPTISTEGDDPRSAPVPWSPGRRLSWSDFLGRPDMASAASATTAYVISYGGTCVDGQFSFEVRNLFQPGRSWVKPLLLMEARTGDSVLEHEQLHFDLAEVHVRELRRALTELTTPCDETLSDRRAVVDRALRSDEAYQRRYDDETESGVNRGRQREWQSQVARQLTALKAWAR